MSEERKARDFLQNNWLVALEVFRLRNQGWTLQSIGDKFGLSRQRTLTIYQKMTKLTTEEAEKVEKYVNKLAIDNTSK